MMAIGKQYDLEERTFQFALHVRAFVQKLPRTIGHIEDAKQLIRASGSVAANYIVANESLSKKGLQMRLKISRKEAKECRLWLRLLNLNAKPELPPERDALIQEAIELTHILSAIIRKTE